MDRLGMCVAKLCGQLANALVAVVTGQDLVEIGSEPFVRRQIIEPVDCIVHVGSPVVEEKLKWSVR